MERGFSRRDIVTGFAKGAVVGGSVAIAYGAGYINGVTEAGRLFLAFLNRRRPDAASTPTEPEDIIAVRKIQSDARNRGEAVLALPQVFGEERGQVRETMGFSTLELNFPSYETPKEIIVPSIADGRIENVIYSTDRADRGRWAPQLVVHMSVKGQDWSFIIQAKNISPLIVPGQDIFLGDPFVTLNLEKNLVATAFDGTNWTYTAENAKIGLAVWQDRSQIQVGQANIINGRSIPLLERAPRPAPSFKA